VLLNRLQGVETLAPAIAGEADISNGNFLAQVLNESLHIHQKFDVRNEEAVGNRHVVHVPVCRERGV